MTIQAQNMIHRTQNASWNILNCPLWAHQAQNMIHRTPECILKNIELSIVGTWFLLYHTYFLYISFCKCERNMLTMTWVFWSLMHLSEAVRTFLICTFRIMYSVFDFVCIWGVSHSEMPEMRTLFYTMFLREMIIDPRHEIILFRFFLLLILF